MSQSIGKLQYIQKRIQNDLTFVELTFSNGNLSNYQENLLLSQKKAEVGKISVLFAFSIAEQTNKKVFRIFNLLKNLTEN